MKILALENFSLYGIRLSTRETGYEADIIIEQCILASGSSIFGGVQEEKLT